MRLGRRLSFLRGIGGVAREIDTHAYPRDELVRILERSAEQFNAPPPARRNIARLKDPHTYVVTTGQQAGLLGGPAYTLYKALTAIQLARRYETEAGGPAGFVPVFWVAADDHDLDEIDHAYFLKPDGDLERVKLELTENSFGCSAADAFAAPAAEQVLHDCLKTLLGDDSAAERYARTYAASSLADAFTSLLTEWLGPLGLVVLRSTDVRPLAREVLRRDLQTYPVVSRLIQEAGASLAGQDYEPGFPNVRAAPHFFVASPQSRVRAHVDPEPGGRLFRERSAALAARGAPGREFTFDELAALIERHPERCSAAAPLRPVVQHSVLPVVTAVLGPGEIAYWAQLQKVHAHFNVVWPVVAPRATLTLVDAAAAKQIRKLGLAPASADLFLNADALCRKVMTGGKVSATVEERRARILQELEKLAGEVNAAGMGLQPLFQKAHARVAHELERIADKTRAVASEREGVAESRVRRLSAVFRPRNSPQERTLAWLPFAVQHPALPQELLDLIDPELREHLVVLIS